MKISKRITAALLSALIIFGLTFVTSAKTDTNKTTITVSRYASKEMFLKKANDTQNLPYAVKVNDKNNSIKVNFVDVGKNCYLTVTGKKVTKDKIPTITVYYTDENNEKVNVEKYKIKVTKLQKQTFKNFALNPRTNKRMTVTNPYAYDYSFTLSDKKIAEIDPAYYAKDKKYSYTVKGLKKGQTTVKVYIKKSKVGEFTIKVDDLDAHIKKSKTTLTLKYNKHGSSSYMSESNAILTELLSDMKAKAKYTVEIKNRNVADKIDYTHYSISGENKNTNLIYATGTGKTKATVYEKTGSKTKKIATLTIVVKKAKMNYVARENRALYDDDIFGHGDFVEYLNLTDNKNLRMAETITNCLINNEYTGSHFKKSDYTITYKSSAPSVATVSKNGVVTAKKVGTTTVKYVISFSDGTKHTGKCSVSVDEDL